MAASNVISPALAMRDLAIPPEARAALDQTAARLRRLLGVLGALALCVQFAYMAIGLWQGWRTSQWSAFDDASQFVIVTLILVTYGGYFLVAARPDLPAAQSSLEAAAAGDDALAPPVADQPAPLAPRDTAITSAPELVGFLARAGGAWASWMSATGVLLLTLGAAGVVLLVLLVVAAASSTTISIGSACAAIACGIYSLAAAASGGLFALRVGRVAGGRVYVWADADGLAWARGSRASLRQRIAWRDLRAFGIIIRHRDSDYGLVQTYAIATGATTFAWRVADHQSRPAQVEASERLCRLVVAHTGLPLRNLSAAADPTTARNLQRQRAADTGPAANTTGRVARLAISARSAGCLPVVVFATLILAKWALQWFQTHH